MRLMKLTFSGGQEWRLNPLHLEGVSVLSDGRTNIVLSNHNADRYTAYTVEESIDEVADEFERATR